MAAARAARAARAAAATAAAAAAATTTRTSWTCSRRVQLLVGQLLVGGCISSKLAEDVECAACPTTAVLRHLRLMLHTAARSCHARCRCPDLPSRHPYPASLTSLHPRLTTLPPAPSRQAQELAAAKGVSLPEDFAAAASGGGLRASVMESYCKLAGGGALTSWLVRSVPAFRDRLIADRLFFFKVWAEVAIDSGGCSCAPLGGHDVSCLLPHAAGMCAAVAGLPARLCRAAACCASL